MHARTAHVVAAAALAAAALAPAAASAQADACYKGVCAGLDVESTGANFGHLILRHGGDVGAAQGVSGGEVDVSYLGDTSTGACEGYATVLPDHIVSVDAPGRLVIEASGRRDVGLVVYADGEWRCTGIDGDASEGARIRGRVDAGTVRVWVVSSGRRHHDYDLDVRLRTPGGDTGQSEPPHTDPPYPDPPPHQHGGRLDPASPDALHASLVYGAYEPPVVMSGDAGGRIDVSRDPELSAEYCVGYTHRTPDHIVTLTDAFDALLVTARSHADTTLVMHGPHGWRCNDDFDGTNPGIEGAFPPGTYRIWVGTYHAGVDAGYELEVSAGRAANEAYVFQGRFEDVDVLFTGDSPHDVYHACTDYAQRSDALEWVDDIIVRGAAIHNSSSWWSADQLCAITALNAEHTYGAPDTLFGSIEEIPFALSCAGDDARRLLQTYVPRAIGDTWVDDVTVNGANNHNGPGYWSPDEVVDIIAANMHDPHAYMHARGTIEGVAFTFSGDSVHDIRRQCETFVASAMDGEWIDDVTVNGAVRHNDTGWWSATDVCMIVASHAGP